MLFKNIQNGLGFKSTWLEVTNKSSVFSFVNLTLAIWGYPRGSWNMSPDLAVWTALLSFQRPNYFLFSFPFVRLQLILKNCCAFLFYKGIKGHFTLQYIILRTRKGNVSSFSPWRQSCHWLLKGICWWILWWNRLCWELTLKKQSGIRIWKNWNKNKAGCSYNSSSNPVTVCMKGDTELEVGKRSMHSGSTLATVTHSLAFSVRKFSGHLEQTFLSF